MNSPHRSTVCLLLLLCISASCAMAQEPTLRFYVQPSGDDTADGLSWDTAMAHPQAAATASEALFVRGQEQFYEVWLAAGTYTRNEGPGKSPSTPTGIVEIGTRISISFYGGFSGVEQYRDDRSWVENEVILDGGGEHACFAVDTNDYSGICGKCRKVMLYDGTFRVDGVTLQNAAYALFWKGQMFPSFRYCTLRNSAQSVYGCGDDQAPMSFINSLILGPGGSIVLDGCDTGIGFHGSTVVGITGTYSIDLRGQGGSSLGSSVLWDCAPMNFGQESYVTVENTCLPMEVLDAIPT